MLQDCNSFVTFYSNKRTKRLINQGIFKYVGGKVGGLQQIGKISAMDLMLSDGILSVWVGERKLVICEYISDFTC